jgi:hypothetical protein
MDIQEMVAWLDRNNYDWVVGSDMDGNVEAEAWDARLDKQALIHYASTVQEALEGVVKQAKEQLQ